MQFFKSANYVALLQVNLVNCVPFFNRSKNGSIVQFFFMKKKGVVSFMANCIRYDQMIVHIYNSHLSFGVTNRFLEGILSRVEKFWIGIKTCWLLKTFVCSITKSRRRGPSCIFAHYANLWTDQTYQLLAKKLSLHNGKANFARAQHALETLEFVEYIVHLIKRRGNFLVIDSANNAEQNCHWRFFFFGQKLEKPFLLCEYQQMPFGHSKLLHNHSIAAKKKRFAVMSMISQQ